MDFFNVASTLTDSSSRVKDLLHTLYDVNFSVNENIFFGINLQWPKFDVPATYSKYFFSFHTEQIDIDWIIKQSKLVYPLEVLVVYDGTIISKDLFPNNVKILKYITWGKQLTIAANKFGINDTPTIPNFKFSSLSFRYSQSKKFITAWILKNLSKEDCILTWHNAVLKQEDLHTFPDSIRELTELDYSFDKIFWNFDDQYTQINNTPISNTHWNIPPYVDALVNITNESFHYSFKQTDTGEYFYPGPYITEKTWKPLLAGRPFVSVGQFSLIKELKLLGLNLDFGFNDSYDDDPGDLTRIIKIFNTLSDIKNMSIKDLYDASIDAVQYNCKSIKNGDFENSCKNANKESLKELHDYLKH